MRDSLPISSLASFPPLPISSLRHPLQRAGALIHTETVRRPPAWVKLIQEAKSADRPNATHVEQKSEKTPKTPYS